MERDMSSQAMNLERFKGLDDVKHIMSASADDYSSAVLEFPNQKVQVDVESLQERISELERKLSEFIEKDNTDLEFILIPKKEKGKISIVVFPDVESA